MESTHYKTASDISCNNMLKLAKKHADQNHNMFLNRMISKNCSYGDKDGYFILGETLRRSTLIAMIIAFFGVCVMIYNDTISGSALGAIIGFISASGFALYSVTIRWKPETPKFTTVVLAGLFCAIFSFFVLGFSFKPFAEMPMINSYLSLLHGLIVASGLILYTLGAKHLPSAELTLLSLMEVVGGVLWVWIPIFGINEVPSSTVILGGIIITLAVVYHGYGARKKREPVLP